MDAGGTAISTTIAGAGLLRLAEGTAASGAIVFQGDGTLAIQGGIMPFASGGTAIVSDGALIVSEGGEDVMLVMDARGYAPPRVTGPEVNRVRAGGRWTQTENR